MTEATAILRLVLAVSLLCTSVSAGELSRRDIRRTTEWEPSDCWKPSAPAFYIYDTSDFNNAVVEFNAYLSAVEAYIDCISNEAEDDYKMLRTILENSLNQKISDVQSELDNARNDLETQRP